MRPLVALLLAAFLAAGGCLGAPTDAGTDAPAAPSAPREEAPTEAAPSEAPPEAFELVLHLTSGPGLSETAVSAGTVPVSANFLDPRWQLGGFALPVWATEEAAPRGFVIERATLALSYSSEAPQQATSGSFGYEEVVVWFGEPDALGPTLLVAGPETLAPNEVATVSAEVPMPPGGYAAPLGTHAAVMIGFTYSNSEAAPILVHVGGENPSTLTLLLRALAPVAGATPLPEVAHDGAFTASHWLAPHPDPNERERRFPLKLDASVVALDAALEGRGASGYSDLDLSLVDASGAVVWAGTTPFATERVRLGEPTLRAIGPGEYELVVASFQVAQGTFTLTVRAWQAPAASDADAAPTRPS